MSSILLEPYQQRGSGWLATKRKGMLVSPAGSGKTIMLAAALALVLSKRKRDNLVKVGWMANTIEQCGQAQIALDQFLIINQSATVKIACAQAGMDWSDRDVLIVDECHHSVAPEWEAQIIGCRGALWGMTATADLENHELQKRLNEIFGNERLTIDRKDVLARLAPAKVVLLSVKDAHLRDSISNEIESRTEEQLMRSRWILEKENREIVARWVLGTNIPRDIPQKTSIESFLLLAIKAGGFWDEFVEKLEQTIRGIVWSRVAWQVVIDFGIVENQNRNRAVIDTALKHKNDHVLILVNKVEHGKTIADQLPGAVPCFSKMGKKKRERALEGFKNGSIWCLVATSLADEGLDVPICDKLILVSGGRSKSKTEQRTGRALRLFAGKGDATIYDFKDEFHPLAAKHSRARLDLYKKLGYQIQTY